MIHLFSDWTAIDRELDRVENLPDFKTTQALDKVLNMSLITMQNDTHVDTSSLLQSEKKESEERGKTWEGTLTAGGASAGPKNPVTYAIYEKARGDEHDFTAGLPKLHPYWLAAMKEGLGG